MANNYITIKTSVISTVTDIRLYDYALEHIQKDHPEVPIYLPSLTHAISTAVQSPTHVESNKIGHYVFVDARSTNASGDPLRVPVKMVEGTSGRIQTAFFAETSKSRKIVWRSGK